MNELVKEWVDKAEGDYHSAIREFRARKHPNYDAAGFHVQQSIEKYFKPSCNKIKYGLKKFMIY